MKEDVMVILYVADQEISKTFYKNILERPPKLDVPGMTSFELSKGLSIGLMPETGIEKILGNTVPSPQSGNGIPRCELYITVEDPKSSLDKALAAGAKMVSECSVRNWGDTVAYCVDPDGHVLAFARPTTE